jgi:hypothetical protein
MNIGDWTLEQIETLVQRYRQRGITEGGKFTLSELLLEQKRRTPSKFDGVEVVKGIIELAKKSPTRLITYGELYRFLSGGLPWKGNATQSEMSRALDRGIHHCVQSSLPILTVVVVRQNGKLAPDAIQGIYDECKELNVDVGIDPELFVNKQLELCRKFVDANDSSDILSRPSP